MDPVFEADEPEDDKELRHLARRTQPVRAPQRTAPPLSYAAMLGFALCRSRL